MLAANLVAWADKVVANAKASAEGELKGDAGTDPVATSPEISVARFEKLGWVDARGRRVHKTLITAALVLLLAGLVAMAGKVGARFGSRSVQNTSAIAPVSAIPATVPVVPSSRPVECDNETGTCAVVQTLQPAVTLRQLADIARALPTSAGNRYRVELSIMPVDVPDLESPSEAATDVLQPRPTKRTRP